MLSAEKVDQAARHLLAARKAKTPGPARRIAPKPMADTENGPKGRLIRGCRRRVRRWRGTRRRPCRSSTPPSHTPGAMALAARWSRSSFRLGSELRRATHERASGRRMRLAPASGPPTCCISPPVTRSPRSMGTVRRRRLSRWRWRGRSPSRSQPRGRS